MNRLTKLLLSAFSFFLVTLFATLIFPLKQARAVSGYTPISATQLAEEIDFFLGEKNAAGYLVWQYSGDLAGNEYFENDRFSFFKGDGTGPGTVCGTLKEKSAQYSGKFVGVNFWSITKPQYSQSMVQDHLNWLKSNCGVNMIRVFAYAGSSSPTAAAANSAKVKAAAEAAGIRVIWVIGDYSNGGGGVPKGAGKDWYLSGGLENLAYIRAVVPVIAGGNTYGVELSNEAHCGGDSSAITAYNIWVSTAALLVKSMGVNNVGIGQMASQPISPCDHPDSNFRQSNSQAGITMSSGHYYSEEERDQVARAADLSPVPFYIGEAGWGGATTESECSADNCKDCTIDPNDPFGTGILMCPLEVPPEIIFDQYQSTCNTEQVNITSNGNTEICTSNGVCVGRGNVTIEEIPDQVHVFLDQSSSSRANTTQDATGRVANNDISNSLNTAPIYKLNPNASNFRQIKNYLTAMTSCQENYDQPGCFPPKLILPSGIAEDDFVSCMGGFGGLDEQNYRTRLDQNRSCNTPDGNQISVNLLEVWNSIDYNILGCLPAYRVEYTNAPPPDPGVWGWFNALLGVNSDQPALSIKEYKTCNASITPFSFGQVESSVANLGSHLLPQSMVSQIQQDAVSRTTPESNNAYLDGPLIFNLQSLQTEDGENVTTQTIAAKINRDNPSCNVDPNTDSSTIIKHDAEAKAAEAIFGGAVPPSNPLEFLFEIDLNPFSSTQPPQTATYLSADITYAGTTEQAFSNTLYSAFTPMAIIEQDKRDNLKVENTEIENQKEVDSETVTAEKTIPNPDPNLPDTTETASWNATTPGSESKSRTHLSITNSFANFLSFSAPAVFNIPRCVIKSFGGAYREESITGCISGITRRPTPNNVCAFSGGPNIASNDLKVVIAKAAAKHAVPVQLLLAMIQGENCRFTSGQRNICAQTDSFFDSNNYLDPGVEYPFSTKCENPGTGADAAFDNSYKGIVSIFEFAHNAGGWGEARDPQYTNVCSINDGVYGIARVLARYKQAATGTGATTQNWSRDDIEKTIVNWVTGRGGINGCATTDADLPRDGDGVWNQDVRDTAVGAIGIFCKYIDEYYDPTSNLYVDSTCR